MVGDIKDEVDTHEEQEIVVIDETVILAKGEVILRDVLHHFKIADLTIPQ
jgi:CBS domain containing-hemolysin-like protein